MTHHERSLASLADIHRVLAELGDRIETPDVSVNKDGRLYISVKEPYADQAARNEALALIARALGVEASPREVNGSWYISDHHVDGCPWVQTPLVNACHSCGVAQ